MATAEDVITIVMIVIVSGLVVSIGYMSYVKTSKVKYENKVYEQKYKMTDNSLSTVLLLSDPQTGMRFNELLGGFFFERSHEIKTPYGTIKVDDTLKKMLDYFFGKNKYLLEAYPIITDIRLYFVIDGSPTMSPMRIELTSTLPNFVQELKDKYHYNVVSRIYILSEDPNVCNMFSSGGIPCEILTPDILYKTHPDITEPYDPKTLTSAKRSFYASSDWASGVAVVSYKNRKYTPSRLELIIPISDEVTLGTKQEDFPGSCMTLPNKYQTDYDKIHYCIECNVKTDFSKSNEIVNRILTMVKANKHIVCPINSFGAKYAESPTRKAALQRYYEEQLLRDPANIPDDSVKFSFCSDSQCRGCIDCVGCASQPECSDGKCPGCGHCDPSYAYWHPEGFKVLNDQFFKVANATGGKNYTIENFGEIYTNIESLINNVVASLYLKIGEKQNRSFFRFQKLVPNPLANDAYMEIRFEYYEDIPYSGEAMVYDVAPVIYSRKLDSLGGSKMSFAVTIRDDNNEKKVFLIFKNATGNFTVELNLTKTSIESYQLFHLYNGTFSVAGHHGKYNMSIMVIDEKNKEYFIENFDSTTLV
jgi:hypothetical protein